jgi:glycine cleavage system H lipoate-binding protein
MINEGLLLTCAVIDIHIARKYTVDHEWVSVSGDVATMGISDYAQKALGDVVFIELPEVGKVLKQKGQFWGYLGIFCGDLR